MARPGLILDRDGTLIEERGYIADPDDIVVLAGVAEALVDARRAGVAIAVVTNQSAVARGILSESELRALHDLLTPLGIDAVYHCPHLPDAGCACRKPRPGLVEQAVAELDLDRTHTLVVGDHLTDCLAARAAGVDGVLVRTGHGASHEAEASAAGFAVVDDLPAAVALFLHELDAAPSREPTA